MKRDASIDILKGWSILTIMLLHYEKGIFPQYINIWCGSFMVAAFYFLSGWILSLKTLPTLQVHLAKRLRSLGIPYLTFSILICIFTFGLCVFDLLPWKILLRDIWKFATLRGIGTLWFLPALIVGEIMFLLFKKHHLSGRLLLLFSVFLYLWVYSWWEGQYRELNDLMRLIDAPLNAISRMGVAFLSIMIGFYLGSYYASEVQELQTWRQLLLSICLLTAYSLMLFTPFARSINILTGTAGSFGLFLLAKVTETWKINCFFSYCGKYSLIIMAVHYSILLQACILINRYFTGQEYLSGYPAFVYFIISVILLIPIITLIHGKARFLLGYSYKNA